MTLHQAKGLQFPVVFMPQQNERRKIKSLSDKFDDIIDKGKNLILRYLAKSEVNSNGKCSVFFEINGQPRTIDIENKEF